ncbi:UvrABC system protein B [Frankliniella fusca]|uniref:UvrABC system protein B n=1 Tax=Frankliniella fusca TaxID=407009 RepID=A0AAE1LH13_9NEOP|nr:UvrABC system protein B [Frankliniella fusca]
MRWHPTLIRMALSLYLKAPGAYKDLCESGFLKLPTPRTLFDYSHVAKVQRGTDETVLEFVAKRATSEENPHKQYHVLMADEMHISKNIVLLKSTGEMIAHLEDPDNVLEPELATKVMAFMVKGVSSNLKHVVASYPVNNPSPKQMYLWTWSVIGALERS